MMRQQHPGRRRKLDQASFLVVSIYGVFASLWILLSDRAVESLLTEPEQIIRVSLFKGWLFVAVTTLLLYVLVRRQFSRIDAAHRSEIAMQEERQRSLDLLQAIADHSDDAIYAKDLQGRYLLFNQAACRYVGKPTAAVLGHDDRDLFPEEQARLLMAIGEAHRCRRADRDERGLPRHGARQADVSGDEGAVARCRGADLRHLRHLAGHQRAPAGSGRAGGT